MKTIKLLITPLILSMGLILASATTDASKENERINKTIVVLKSFSRMKESIPHNLISQYQGIVIIPNLINAGFVAGGKRGRGIAMVKMDDGKWSDPVFVTLTGGSVGLQIGVQAVDLVLVFRHKGVLTKVKSGDVTIGGDASVTAGPIGRSTSANTDYKLEAEVYSYSRSKGLFAGISINGASLSIDKKSNASYYGPEATSPEIFEMTKSDKVAVHKLKETLKLMQ